MTGETQSSPAHTEARTTVGHWEGVWQPQPRPSLPSSLNVTTRNLQRLLRSHVPAGARFLEIGCAPGKLLAWVAARLHAQVSGLDYSSVGIERTRTLFEALNLQADLRHEDVFTTSFAAGSFDVVYSAGVIEHFDDPRLIIARHVDLLASRGLALVAIPNYGGIYGRLQARLDPENLAIHNTSIMTPAALRALAPLGEGLEVRACYWGRLAPWLLSLERAMPRQIAWGLSLFINGVGILQPRDLRLLAPLIILTIRRTT